MRMRKYGMTGRRVAQLKRLLRNDRIQVKRIVVAAHDKREDSVYVFFAYAEEELMKDKATFYQLKVKAEEVTRDIIYAKLTNTKQRELYLLDHYNLSKKESGDVIELAKIIEIEKAEGKSESEKEEIKGGDKKK
jgi:hypothetical protein